MIRSLAIQLPNMNCDRIKRSWANNGTGIAVKNKQRGLNVGWVCTCVTPMYIFGTISPSAAVLNQLRCAIGIWFCLMIIGGRPSWLD